MNSTSGIRDIGDSAVGKLLESEKFKTAFQNAMANEMYELSSYEAGSPSEQARIDEAVSLHVTGYDAQGNRVNHSSLWDFASHNYVSDNNGNWRIIAGESIDNGGCLPKVA